MNNNGWQKLVTFINSKEVGHVFRRPDLILWGNLNNLSSGSIDGYRNQLVQGGYFKRTKPGTYELQNKLPTGTTTTEMYHLSNNDRLKYLEKVVTRKEREKHDAERKAKHAILTETNTRILAEAKSRSCLDCKGSFPAVAMAFSYRQLPHYHRKLSRMILGETSRLISEIHKCDVVCMNCHLIRNGVAVLA